MITIPSISSSKVIETGSIIGLGSFCTVKAVEKINQDEEGDIYFKKIVFEDDCETGGEVDCQLYAIKQVRKDLPLRCKQEALFDMENEARILMTLSHPNIVKLYGVGVESESKNYALLMERICWTLEEQISMWKLRSRSIVSSSSKLLCGRPFIINRNIQHGLWKERINVAYQLANVMNYIHGLRIVFRDLKPTNCGIDYYGNFKLFDFGLAAHLDKGTRVGMNQYKLTGNTGTQKYMAPEVARCKPYGTPADTYSFAIILWEMSSLQTAFKGETRLSHARKVYGHRNFRPKLSPYWPRDLRELIKECWMVDAASRPSFYEIKDTLSDMSEKYS